MERERRTAGFSLVETVISGAVLAMLAGAVLSATTAAADRRQDAAVRARANQLAHDLIGEMRRLVYGDPTATGGESLGPEAGESDRSAFDDVDDFDGYKEEPIVDAGGVELSGFSGFARRVSVIWITPEDRTNPAAADVGLKRATVWVTYAGKPMAEVSAEFTLVREGAWR